MTRSNQFIDNKHIFRFLVLVLQSLHLKTKKPLQHRGPAITIEIGLERLKIRWVGIVFK